LRGCAWHGLKLGRLTEPIGELEIAAVGFWWEGVKNATVFQKFHAGVVFGVASLAVVSANAWH